MPNWCYTNITINCKNAKEAKMLHNKIEEWTTSDYCKNGFGRFWLGNIVGNSGIDSMKDGKDFSVRCRGTLEYLDYKEGENTVSAVTETAWCPMLKMWEKICEKHLTEHEIIYTAEEPGCGLFYTNDPVLSGVYIIDSMNDDFTKRFLGEPYDSEADKEYLKGILQKCLDSKEESLDDLIKMFEKSDYEDVWIRPWEHMPISELD